MRGGVDMEWLIVTTDKELWSSVGTLKEVLADFFASTGYEEEDIGIIFKM